MTFRFGRLFDRAVIAVILCFVLAIFFSIQLRNMLYGILLAVPVTALLLYAYVLWSRRGTGERAARERVRWQLHNLMILPERVARRIAVERVARRHGIDSLREQGDCWMGLLKGREVCLMLLQRPLDARIDSDAVLAIYHATMAERIVIIATAPFSTEASIFAQQLRNPSLALIGPDELTPMLRDLPIDEEAFARDKKKRRRATMRELRERASDPARIRRYLIYGACMLAAYIALDIWAFLIPGLACIFLAVIARRQRARKTGLFSE